MAESVWPEKRDSYMLSDVVILGKEKETYYLGIIADKGSQHDMITLKATRANLGKLDYVKAKMQYWGLTEEKRGFIMEELKQGPVEVCVAVFKKSKELIAVRKGLSVNAVVR